ncbi:hypothetical protein [Qipengyuania soli]|uniref:Uncharacterized protein n=1 Tax=Qipengyuania soli TaxID=2782568 RepID=A0A7S8IVS2_9SPHN|nr:hypothetical protein [Qipengyuania soli]QPC99136.1 hypothetical protein IRL76_00695 [Qipengyuania soli]
MSVGLFESSSVQSGLDGRFAMEEPLGAFEVEVSESERGGSFARGALIALPLALSAWALLYLVL